MVLESLLNPFVLKQKPWEMFFAGFFHSFIAGFLANLVFPGNAGLMMVFLIVLASLPTLYVTIRDEEQLDFKFNKEWRILQEHIKVITFLLFLFLGITASLVTMYVFLPGQTVDSLFGLQQEAVQDLAQVVKTSTISGQITHGDLFVNILVNNTRVLFFCIVFSLLYGTGAIFILTWNASTVATAMGDLFKSKISGIASLAGFSTISTHFGAATFSFFRYMTHGIFEIGAYFVAGLAGSILSVALIKHSLKDGRVLKDSMSLVGISFAILVFAALVEVYITPIFFS